MTFLEGESTLWGSTWAKKQKNSTFFLSFHATLWETQKGIFDTIISNTIIFIFQMWIIFQQVFLFFQTFMLIWLKKIIQIFFCEITWMKLSSYEIEMVQSIQIQYMYRYFMKLGDHLNDFWNIFAIYSILVWLQFFQWFNINSKVRLFFTILFFGFWTTLLQVLFAKKCFNISLVEVKKTCSFKK